MPQELPSCVTNVALFRFIVVMVAFVIDDEGVAVVVMRGTDGNDDFDDDVSMTPKIISTAFSSTQGAAGFATS